ncbi:hypothetical protein TSMEX_001493 [Taenia solium]|eukprot:TsM_000853900 transcript=TsM_000853900 gene=TsM_000853900
MNNLMPPRRGEPEAGIRSGAGVCRLVEIQLVMDLITHVFKRGVKTKYQISK